MPVARLPPVTAFAIDGGTIAALPQLRELHLALFPGWRGILRSWFEQRVLGRVETRQRSIPRRQRLADGTAAPFDARERSVQGAESLLKALRSNPRPGVGDVPTGLTPHMLDHLADHANLGKGGRNGGYTVAKAVELAETWAADPAAFERVLRQKQSAKARRRG
ncbi:MAG TPA: hypothetical protein VH062_10290 [Polyangiaceae bacterium]|nr:hypothetical protein [Polyangiaceae bacterium]